MDLFLTEEIPISLKKTIAERIREVEENLMAKPVPVFQPYIREQGNKNVPRETNEVPQAPSMQRIMAAHPEVPVVTAPAPQTPAAALALQQRAELLKRSLSDKPEPGRTAPRKG